MNTNYSVNPYIFFTGRCEEAIEFYSQAVGAQKLMVMRYKDAPPEAKKEMCNDAGEGQNPHRGMDENKIMHARVAIGGSTVLLSDGPCSGKYDGFSLSLTAPTAADAERVFNALAAGGQVEMPLVKTFFSPAFGILNDKFGVKWMIYVEGARPS